ncbi:MAG: flavodoxin family protein [Spirochaetales bacterium]|nr:flavodoxin family protein [Spirochaetales bacterium]
MKILLVSGSRNREGQTARAARALLSGAESEGAETEEIFLPEYRIKRCRQCNEDGWGLCAEEARCIIKDDFAMIFEKVKQAGLVVFATPVYLWEMSESLWCFCTRMRRICFQWKKYYDMKKKPAAVLAVAGGGGTGTIRTLFQMEQTLDFSGFDVVDYYPVKRLNLEAKLPRLVLAGKWLASAPGTIE